MLRMTRIAQMTVRLTGLALIVLGILIWTGNAALVGAHMALGLLFVLALLYLGGLGFRARIGRGLPIRAHCVGALRAVVRHDAARDLGWSPAHLRARVAPRHRDRGNQHWRAPRRSDQSQGNGGVIGSL